MEFSAVLASPFSRQQGQQQNVFPKQTKKAEALGNFLYVKIYRNNSGQIWITIFFLGACQSVFSKN